MIRNVCTYLEEGKSYQTPYQPAPSTPPPTLTHSPARPAVRHTSGFFLQRHCLLLDVDRRERKKKKKKKKRNNGGDDDDT